jgi:hypothetical protein
MQQSDESGHETSRELQTLPGNDRALPTRRAALDATIPSSNLIRRPEAGSALMPHALPGSEPMAHAIQFSEGVQVTRAAGPSQSVLHALETLRVRIHHGAGELRAAGLGSMSVVLRPNPETEMQLRLTLSNGQIEIDARMQRGDFTGLNAQWGQLQHTLSVQGIRLNPLDAGETVPSGNPPSGSQDFSQHQHAFQSKDRPWPSQQEAENDGSTKRRTPPRSTPSTKVQHFSRAGGLWESWA